MRLFTFLFALLLAVVGRTQNFSLGDYCWKQTATSFSVYGNNSKGIQGGAYYKGKYYQFHDKTGGIRVFDVNTMTAQTNMINLTCDPNLHFGSVSFSNEKSYKKNGIEINTSLPLIYATGHYVVGGENKEVVDIIDIENNTLVKQFTFPNRKDDVIAAWDFEGKRFWIVGYEPNNGYAVTDYYINEYHFDNEGNIIADGETIVITGDGTLQDCEYVDGHIYILVGWGESAGHFSKYDEYKITRPSHIYGKIHDYNTQTKTLEMTLQVDNVDEFEGFAYVPDTRSFIATSWDIPSKKVHYWHVALPGTEPYYTTLAVEGKAYDRYNVDAQKNYELYTLTLDDMADDMGLPGDAASVTAAKINYKRSGVKGVNSVCLPFALKPEMVNGGIYTVSAANETSVTLTKQADGVAAGVPCFVKSDSNWNISLDCMVDNDGEMYNVPLLPVASDESATAKLFGSFETREIGAGFYKINSDGSALVRTTETSKTFPYRAYLELLESTAARIIFTEEGADAIMDVRADNATTTVYNLSGQRVSANAKGIVIINGRKVIR